MSLPWALIITMYLIKLFSRALKLKIIPSPLSRLSPTLTMGRVSHSVAMFVGVTVCVFVCPWSGDFWSNNFNWFMTCDTYRFSILESWPPFTADDWGVRRGRYDVVTLGNCDRWQMTCDMWHLTPDIWHVTWDTWHITSDFCFIWFVQKEEKNTFLQKPESAKSSGKKSIKSSYKGQKKCLKGVLLLANVERVNFFHMQDCQKLPCIVTVVGEPLWGLQRCNLKDNGQSFFLS